MLDASACENDESDAGMVTMRHRRMSPQEGGYVNAKVWSLTMIGALWCVRSVARDIEHGAHDCDVDRIRRAVTYNASVLLANEPRPCRVVAFSHTVTFGEMGKADGGVFGWIEFRGFFGCESFRLSSCGHGDGDVSWTEVD